MEDAVEEGFEGGGWGGFETRPYGGGVGAACVCGDGLSARGEGDCTGRCRDRFQTCPYLIGGGIAPGHEAVASGGEGADLGVEAIGDDEALVVGEEAGDVVFVGLELVEGLVDVGVFVCGVFEFDDGDG